MMMWICGILAGRKRNGLQADEHVVNTRLSKVQVEEALENLVHADIEIEDD